jgi:hypothetical protein
MNEPITNKQQMYDLLCADKLGNHFSRLLFPDWYLSAYSAGFPYYVYSIRYGLALGGPWKYNIDKMSVISEAIYNEYNCPTKKIWVTSMPPTAKHILNGEIQRNEHGLDLIYGIKPVVMREALQTPLYVTGLKTKIVLEQYCNPKSYDMIMELLDNYPDHVIEFTVFDKDVGVMLGHNTIIWEVRKY